MNDITADPALKRILFVHFGGIGDVILAFPAIQSLREAFPNARLTLLVESRARGVGAFNPAIDEVLTFDAKARPTLGDFLNLIGTLRGRYFDLAIASGRSPAIPLLLLLTGARHRIGYDANPLARTLTASVPLNSRQYAGDMYYDLVRAILDTPPRLPQVAVAPEDRAWAADFLAAHGLKEGAAAVVLHPGASKMAEMRGIHKTWAPANWAMLARQFDKAGIRVVLAGGPDDDLAIQAIMAELEFAGERTESSGTKVILAHGRTRSLGQLAGLIQQARLLVAVDSAPMHLGVAVGTPTVAIFGPTDPEKLLPSGTMHQAVHVSGLACRPCLWDRRQTTCSELTCLGALTVDMVLQAAFKALPADVGTER